MAERKHPHFGDIVENPHASDRNPLKRLVFVRVVRRTGRLNPGTYYELTDTKGRFHEFVSEGVTVVGGWPQDAHLIGAKDGVQHDGRPEA